MRDVIKENVAKTLLCPIRNGYCNGELCPAWTVSWENCNEGYCAAFRATYEQEIGQGWKKYGRRIMDTQKKLLARLEQAEADLRAKEKEEYRIFQELKQLSDVAERLPVLLRKAEQERDAARADLERVQAEAASLREALEALVGDVNALASESDGVSGFHLNGDLAPWGELLEGGRYESWLGYTMDRANAALSTSAGADLLAELARLREVERLALEYRAKAMGFRTRDRLGWQESEAAFAAGKLHAAGEALFAALAELEQIKKETTPNG